MHTSQQSGVPCKRGKGGTSWRAAAAVWPAEQALQPLFCSTVANTHIDSLIFVVISYQHVPSHRRGMVGGGAIERVGRLGLHTRAALLGDL